MKAPIVIGVLLALYHGLAFADVRSGEAKSFFCDLCHNTGFHDGTAPLLQAQPAPYLVLQLQAFKDKRRSGGDMTTNVSSMSPRRHARHRGLFCRAEAAPHAVSAGPSQSHTRPPKGQ